MLQWKAFSTFAVIGAMALGLAGCKLVGSANLDKDEAKANYALGLEIGSNLRQLNVKEDPAAILAGVADALDGKEPRVARDEIRTAIMKIREGGAVKAKEEGIKYLEKNKAKSGVTTTASGLQYEVIKEGTGETPADGDMVKVNYKGTFIDGKVFDESKDAPAEFPIGQIIKGWDEALKLMKVGSKWKLTIPSELAYQERGAGPIPPHSVLVFEVELLEVKKGAGMPPGHGAGDGHDHGHDHGAAPKGKSGKASGK